MEKLMLVARKSLVLAVAVTVLSLAAGGTACWFHDWPVRKFAVVEKGVLYRSAQPDAHGLKDLRDHYGIRTIFDLREDRPKESWQITEQRFCAENGIKYIKLSLSKDEITEAQLKTFLDTMSDPQRRPALVHCELGKSRTGLVVATYRVMAQGWSYDAALAESYKFKNHMEPGYAACLKKLAERATSRPAVGLSAAAPAK